MKEKGSPGDAFEAVAKAFFRDHPEITNEWRTVKSRWWGDRIQLVCAAGSSHEVYASLKGGQISVGDRDDHYDFEDFGRNIPDEEVALEAFNHLVELLSQHGHLGALT